MPESIDQLRQLICNAKTSANEVISEIKITRCLWNDVLFDLMDQPREYHWRGVKDKEKDCFCFEGTLIIAEDKAPEVKQNLPIGQLDEKIIAKTYRKLSRKVALVIMSEMLNTDTCIDEIASRILASPVTVSHKFLNLINGCPFPNSLDFISDVCLVMDSELDCKISKSKAS